MTLRRPTRGPGLRLAALAAVTALVTGGSTGVASAASGVKAMWGPGIVNGVSQFPIYRDLGVTVYQDTLNWFAIATTRPLHPRDPHDRAYRWPAALDATLAQADTFRMGVALEIFGSPPWANGGRTYVWAPNPKDFADFAYAASLRYPGVHLWMVWGEPSRAHNFKPFSGAPPGTRLTAKQAVAPHSYARILDATYGSLKQASEKNLVIGGMTYTSGDISTRQWIENLRLPNGQPPRLDLYGHNPFSFRRPNLANPPLPQDKVDFSALPRLARWVDRYLHRRGQAPIRLYLAEWTIPTGVDSEFDFHVNPPLQADWISAGMRIMRSWSRIYSLAWIHLRDDRPGGSTGGLFYHNGQRKPGYFAFKQG